MKKLFLKTMLLLCALVVGSSSLWAETETVTPNTGGVFTNASNFSYEAVKLSTGNTNPAFAAGSVKLYVKNTLTITPQNGETITGISLTGTWNQGGSGSSKAYPTGISSSPAATLGDATPGTGSHTITWSGSTNSEVVFTINGSKGNLQVTSITVTYTPASSSPLDHITLGGTYPTEFGLGEEFSHEGMTVTAHYEDNSTSDATSAATFSGYDMNTLGNQTVTVSYTKGSVTKTAQYGIKVVPAPTAVVTLDLVNSDWGFPSEYDTTQKSYTNNGYTITLDESSNGHKKCIVSGELVSLIFGKSGATLTLPAFGFNVSKIKVYGQSSASDKVTFNVFVGDDAVSTQATSSKVDHEFTIAADKRAAGTIYTIKVTNSNNCQISKIEVWGIGCETGLVGDAGWATYVTTSPVRFLEGDAFAVTSASDKVYMETVTDVPSNTPVILKGTGRKTATLLDAEPAAPANELAISDGSAVDGFVLAKKNDVVGFYKWNGGSLTSGKVYLPSSAVTSSSRDFIGFEGDVTGINEVKNQKETVNGIFDLQGRKVVTPSKGLYIVNGKKVVIK